MTNAGMRSLAGAIMISTAVCLVELFGGSWSIMLLIALGLLTFVSGYSDVPESK